MTKGSKIPKELKITDDKRDEAEKFIQKINHPYILIQSQSLHTNKENSHWPHWESFINYVIENNNNAVTAGTITINTNSSVEIPSGTTWALV